MGALCALHFVAVAASHCTALCSSVGMFAL